VSRWGWFSEKKVKKMKMISSLRSEILMGMASSFCSEALIRIATSLRSEALMGMAPSLRSGTLMEDPPLLSLGQAGYGGWITIRLMGFHFFQHFWFIRTCMQDQFSAQAQIFTNHITGKCLFVCICAFICAHLWKKNTRQSLAIYTTDDPNRMVQRH
jgi:hypothetical protein